MIERAHLESISKRQKEINKMQAALNDEFAKYKQELFKKAREVLQWKDENLGQEFLKCKRKGHIHELRSECLVLCLPDWDDEMPTQYYIVYFDEIFSEDWKEDAIKKYKEKLEEERITRELEEEAIAIELEARERAELKRLQEKYKDK